LNYFFFRKVSPTGEKAQIINLDGSVGLLGVVNRLLQRTKSISAYRKGLGVSLNSQQSHW